MLDVALLATVAILLVFAGAETMVRRGVAGAAAKVFEETGSVCWIGGRELPECGPTRFVDRRIARQGDKARTSEIGFTCCSAVVGNGSVVRESSSMKGDPWSSRNARSR